MSSRIDLTIAQGDTVAEGYASTNSITGVAPTSDLVTVEVVVKDTLQDADSAAALELKSSGAGVTITDANGWKFTVNMTAAETLALTPKSYVWACTTIDVAGNTREAFRGTVRVKRRGGDPSS